MPLFDKTLHGKIAVIDLGIDQLPSWTMTRSVQHTLFAMRATSLDSPNRLPRDISVKRFVTPVRVYHVATSAALDPGVQNLQAPCHGKQICLQPDSILDAFVYYIRF
jgi:hypothetical protein